ncbi:MAG TPA: vWA domain-containing protein, partial [Planctomycetota bacterium]|nr:vWA domain-containing protein [Planctomycetota bacterium]
MNITLQYPWLLLLILPTAPLIVRRGLRAGFPGLRAGLYGVVAAGLVLILATPVLLPQGDRIPSVYLIDYSDSILDPQEELARLGEVSGGGGGAANGPGTAVNTASDLDRFTDSQAWLFGRKVMMLSGGASQANASVDRTGSRYATALDVLDRYAADHPDGCALLIGDGLAQDMPEALARAAELRRRGWSLDVMPGPAAGLDLGVVAVDTPAATPPNETAPIRVRVQANAAGAGNVELRLLDRDGKAVLTDNRAVTFERAGELAVTFGAKMARAGVYRVVARVHLAAPPAAAVREDAQPGNDVGYQLLAVRPETIEILHVVDDAKPSAWGIQTQYLTEHFPDLHWKYQAMTPKRFAAVGAVPRSTRLLVLENIPFADLPAPLWRSINEFVQVEGGGLLALGGDKAFGAGEHKPGGDLERCLPVKMEPPKNRRIDIVLVIDVSASMADSIVESAVKTAKLDAAKEAVWGLLGGQSLLGDDDRIALVAFSADTQVKLPFTPVKDALTIKQQLAGLEAQGSTKPAPAVAKAFDLIAGQKADRTFIVLVTDGQPSSNGVEEVNFASGQNAAIIELLRKNIHEDSKTSFWPVFIGEAKGTDPYRKTLKDFARFGNGKFIWPQSAGNSSSTDLDAATLAGALKKILDEGNKDRFVSDAPFVVSATGQAHPLAPLLAQAAPFAWRNRVGIKGDGELLWQAGEVSAITAADAGATVKKPEPLFAAGQYGNGRSAALAMRFNELAVQARKENPKLA